MRVLLVIALALAVSCGREGAAPTAPSPPPPPSSPQPPLASLRIDATSIGLGAQAGLLVGQTHQLIARGAVTGGGQIDVSPVWQVDNRSILTIDAQGRITGVGNGLATVFATAPGASATLVVRVVPDYGGTWNGTWTLARCEAPQPSFCAQSFPVGARRTLDVSVAPDRAFAFLRMSWTLDGVAVGLATSVPLGDDGALSLGDRFYDGRGFEVALIAASWRAQLSGPDSLTARMTLIHGLIDGARTEWEGVATRRRP